VLEIESQVSLRSGRPTDKGFIYQTWLRSFVLGSGFCRGIPRRIAYAYQERLVKKIMETAEVLIVHPRNIPDQIIGYVVVERHRDAGLVLHYAYTKEAYRRLGVAKMLILAAKGAFGITEKYITCTHMTLDVSRNIKREDLIYNPYLLLKGEPLDHLVAETG
jgi:hypothetical protein